MASTSRRTADLDLAAVCQGIALGLLLAWAGGQLRQLLPPALLQPAWQLQAAEVLRAGAALPLLAMLMLLLAHRYDPGAAGLGPRLLWLRRLACAAAIGFLLLIPLQVSANLRQIGQTTARETTELRRLAQVAQAIEAADTAEAMNRAIAQLPGLPPNFRGQFSRPIPEVRSALLVQIRPQIRRLDNRLAQIRGERLQAALKQMLFDGLAALGYAIAFAAVGRLGEDQPTLWQRCLWLPADLRARLGQERRAGRKSSGMLPSEEWIQSMREESEDRGGRS